MGKYRLGAPEELCLKLRNQFGLKYFIETGTYKAGTSRWAADYFEKVYTIEGWPDYYQKALHRLAGYENVEPLFGDSRELLPQVLERLDGPALIWLDAHYLGNSEISKGTEGECPLRDELQVLNQAKFNHFVLIDDARYFTGELQKIDRNYWPDTQEIAEILQRAYPKFIVPDYEDVMICVPLEARGLVLEHMRAYDLRVIVASSNKYLGILPGCAYWFNKNWSPDQPVTVLRYEVRPPKLPPNFHNVAIGKQADYTWSSGLKAYLDGLYLYEHIILLLEDYYLTRPVNMKHLTALWHYAQAHPEIVKIDLTGDRLKFPHGDYQAEDVGNLNLIQSEPEAQFRGSLQAAIWRVDYLKKHLNPDWDAWQFERHGCRDDSLILGVKEADLEYINAVGGQGHKPGEYDHKKIPAWMWLEMLAQGVAREA